MAAVAVVGGRAHAASVQVGPAFRVAAILLRRRAERAILALAAGQARRDARALRLVVVGASGARRLKEGPLVAVVARRARRRVHIAANAHVASRAWAAAALGALRSVALAAADATRRAGGWVVVRGRGDGHAALAEGRHVASEGCWESVRDVTAIIHPDGLQRAVGVVALQHRAVEDDDAARGNVHRTASPGLSTRVDPRHGLVAHQAASDDCDAAIGHVHCTALSSSATQEGALIDGDLAAIDCEAAALGSTPRFEVAVFDGHLDILGARWGRGRRQSTDRHPAVLGRVHLVFDPWLVHIRRGCRDDDPTFQPQVAQHNGRRAPLDAQYRRPKGPVCRGLLRRSGRAERGVAFPYDPDLARSHDVVENQLGCVSVELVRAVGDADDDDLAGCLDRARLVEGR